MINMYRYVNGKNKLTFSDSLSNLSKDQVKVILKENAVTHSHTTSEIATLGITLPFVKVEMDSFIIFIKAYLKTDYKEPKTDKEIRRLFKEYVLYQFHISQNHRAILIGNYKYVGFHVELLKITYNPNILVINGKSYKLNKFIDHYEGDYCAVINFKM